MKKKTNGCAVIEIGTNSVKMEIFQISKSELICLDKLDYPINIGHEIFQSQNVNFATLNELNMILQRFKSACDVFGIEDIRVISTTVMRDAQNHDIIADRIATINKLEVQVLADSYEKSLIYFDIINRLSDDNTNYSNAVIAYIGSGSIGIARYDGKTITHSSNIPLGTVKFHDILSSLSRQMKDYHSVIEEYLHPVFARLNLDECDCLILTGVETARISELCNSEEINRLSELAPNALRTLHHEIKPLTGENIARRYNITESEGNMLSTTLSISYELTKNLRKNTRLLISKINMERIIAKHVLMPKIANDYQNHVHESSLKVAMFNAEKYNCNPNHYNCVMALSTLFFNKLKKIHGLCDEYKKTLEIAAILHSCGQYVNTRQRTNCSFDLIKNMNIYGMTAEEIKLVAFVAASNEFVTPNNNDLNFRLFADNKELEIMKLAAIFRLANALDKSQKGKITIQNIKIINNKLIIKATATGSALLEEWAFNQCVPYFAEIFGITPQLIIKSQLI